MDEPIPLDIAKQIIISSLKDFNPDLGARASGILNSSRFNCVEESSPRTGMMQYRPKGLKREDLEKAEMWNDHFAEKFGPHFTDQTNELGPGIIDYEYTFTHESVLYLAHELGHAIADDIQNANNLTFRDFSPNELEKQAYFIQSIVADRLDPLFNAESGWGNTNNSVLAGSFNRARQRFDAVMDYEDIKSMPPADRGLYIEEILSGRQKDRSDATAQQPISKFIPPDA